MKKNYKFYISYDGSRYFGWEKQKNTDMTIQGKLENLLAKMTHSDLAVTVISAGRTDAGVHAENMICNAFLDTDMDLIQIKDYMNHYLPDDISVNEVKEAGDRFHSRYNALGKTYCYRCYIGPSKPIFNRKYVYTLAKKPNIDDMIKASQYLIGTYDFKAFCSNSKMKKSTIRTIDSILIEEKNDEIQFTFHGNGFLHHMIRIIIGTLLEVGFGTRPVDNVAQVLKDKKRAQAGFTAPAHGLCLKSIDYH